MINQINLGSNFMRPIELINRLIQIQPKLIQYTKKKKNIERFLARKGVLFGRVLGLNTLCRSCSSHTTLVGLLYLGGDKLETVCTGYKVQQTKGLNLLKESECRALVQIMLCNFFFKLIKFKSIIQSPFVLFLLSLCLHQQIFIDFSLKRKRKRKNLNNYSSITKKKKKLIFFLLQT